MTIGLTLLCKNEIDIIRPWLHFHLRHYDFVYISDNVSTDGTWEAILEHSARSGLILRQIQSQDYCQAEWVYDMDAHLRYLGCDWVVNLDADEFLNGDVREACRIADIDGYHQIYPKGTFMRATHDDDSESPEVLQRIQWHDPWDKVYSNDKAIIKTDRLIGVCQGNHWAHWSGDPIRTAPAKDLYLYHYEQRSPEQLVKKYSGIHSATKLAHMGEGYRAKNELWLEGGDDALIKYWNEHCVYDSSKLEKGSTEYWYRGQHTQE